MTPLENLYYAFGEIAYAIAVSDGNIQKPERQEFVNIVTKGLDEGKAGLGISEIIFHVLDKQKASLEETYKSAMRELKLNSHYLSPAMKASFLSVIDKIAAAFPPVTREESDLTEKFRADISALHGDPVYYDKK